MPALRSWYCGLARYFSNSSAQAASESGGSAPVTGRHSVIERPEPVSRVAPPTTTMTKTSAATIQSQRRMPAWLRPGFVSMIGWFRAIVTDGAFGRS